MADYENLLDSIDAVIKSNNRREITGQILQNTLHQMVGSLGENYQLAGFATPTLDPNSPDQNVFYITDEAGVYTNFDNITLGAGLSFLMWKNEEWTSKTLDVVTADWVDEHYVSKAFLRKVFQFFDEDGVEIFPNDTESVVDNIKAMCGLWTNEYLSALGLGEGSTIPTTLAALNDVTITNPQDGQALVYDAASLHWVNATIQSGVDMSVVWAALAGSTNEQINISHLTSALSDYVTATSLATTLQSYVTTSALATELANYASQSWVETNYVSKAFFNSLFEAQDVNGNAITPNNSGQTTIDRLKILVGAYTEQYLSALGLSSSGGGGGSSTLAGLNDVTITNPQDGQALIYDAQSSHWVNGAAISMSAVWTALAAATSEQINSSHLTSALSGYVTTSALASELANYVTTSGLATTLADYVTTSALATTLADYGSKTWVESNYISKAFFNRLFQAFAPLAEGQTEPTQVEPNDTTTTIDNIKAMFGLWTEQYLSALGLSAGGGHTIGVLDDLNDVTITNPQTNQVLRYNGTQWVNDTAPSGATALSGLTDVAISSLADKDLLQWDYASGKWKNVVLSTVMSAYALASSIPTNVSQLTNDSGYITSAALSGYATTSQLANYLPLSGGTLTGALNIKPTSGRANINLVSVSDVPNDLYFGSNNQQDWSITSRDSQAGRWIGLYCNYGGGFYAYKVTYDSTPTVNFMHNPYVGDDALATQPWVGNNYISKSGGTITGGQLSIRPTGGNYTDGIRIHARSSDNNWAAMILCGSENTGDSGTSANTWFVGTRAGDFYIARNGTGVAGDGSAYLRCISNVWDVNGNTIIHSGNIGSQSVSYATSAGSAPASDVYSWAKASTKPSYDFSEIGKGNAIITDGSNYLLLREHYAYRTGMYYHTAGNEAFVFGNTNSVTSWIFATTDPANMTNWASLTPALQIKQNCVYINSLIPNDSTPAYQLYVNGNIATKPDNGAYVQIGAVRLEYDSTNNAIKVISSDGSSSANFYATGGIAALGATGSGGGGGGDVYWSQLQDNTNTTQIASSHLTTALASYLPLSGGTMTGTLTAATISTGQNGKIYLRVASGQSRYDSGVRYDISGTEATVFANGYGSATFNFVIGTSLNNASKETSTAMKISTSGVTAAAFTQTSDERTKCKLYDINLSVEDIAKAPIFAFRWNDMSIDKEVHAGSTAQYWKGVLSEVVSEANDDMRTLSMQYGVAALVSSITIARKVVNHEERITALEKENADLKQAYSFIKNAYEQLRLKIA